MCIRDSYSGWLRNLAVALGNSKKMESVRAVLASRLDDTNEMVKEHIIWAIEEQKAP